MKETEFINYWNKEYPDSLPIGHEIKSPQKRWFRIHSLPNSKRYAETESEYKIILDRQNQLIKDLIGEGSEIFITFGLYTNDITNNNYKKLTDFNKFLKITTFDLHEERPEYYEKGVFLDIYVMIDTWKKDQKNELLKAIADDKIMAMIICPSKKCLIAPYDGGVDIIVDSENYRNQLKLKYKNWLSKRDDGL